MRTATGSNVDSNAHSGNAASDTRHVLPVMMPVTPCQAEFLELVRSHGYGELVRSLKTVHDLALYFSEVPFDTAEKTALFDLKVLWEGFEKMQGSACNEGLA